MSAAPDQIRAALLSMRDPDYRAFHAKLIPTVDPDTIIGIRTPVLRKYAGRLWREAGGIGNLQEFLRALPHAYYEENNLHIFLIAFIPDYEDCIRELNAFLPYMDNWATCDAPAPRVLQNHLEELLAQIRVWLTDPRPYTVRYAIGLLMRFYLDEAFDPEYPKMVADAVSDEYYVNMMRAWYFATALAKRYEAIVPYLKERRLDLWTHNRTIQKAVESFRITAAQKEELRLLRRPKN